MNVPTAIVLTDRPLTFMEQLTIRASNLGTESNWNKVCEALILKQVHCICIRNFSPDYDIN